jgi:hypothetical protein
MARLSAPAMVDRRPRSKSSFIPLKELIDLFSQLFAEHQHWAGMTSTRSSDRNWNVSFGCRRSIR